MDSTTHYIFAEPIRFGLRWRLTAAMYGRAEMLEHDDADHDLAERLRELAFDLGDLAEVN